MCVSGYAHHVRVIRTSCVYADTHCNTLQHTATHCSTLQHTAAHCNTLPHTATHWYIMCGSSCMCVCGYAQHVRHAANCMARAGHTRTHTHAHAHTYTHTHTHTRTYGKRLTKKALFSRISHTLHACLRSRHAVPHTHMKKDPYIHI